MVCHSRKIPFISASFEIVAFSYKTYSQVSVTLLIAGLVAFLTGCGPKTRNLDHIVEMPRTPEPYIVELPYPGRSSDMYIKSIAGDISTLNKVVAEDTYSMLIIDLFSRALVWIDKDTSEVVPGLAKSWEVSEDNKTYTFHLRRGVYWSDGHPFDADDVIFSFDCYFDERYPNRNQVYMAVNNQPYEITKIDDYTVQVTTAVVYAPTLLTLVEGYILPEHILREDFENGDLFDSWSLSTLKNEPEKLVALGPYVLESYKPGERITLVRNPNFYMEDQAGTPLPYVERVIVTIYRDMQAAAAIFAQGETDTALDRILPADVPWVEKNADKFDFTIYNWGPTANLTFLWFNQHEGVNEDGKPFVEPHKQKWFRDKRFRQAISYAINREGIINAVIFGRGQPLYSFVPSRFTNWHNPEIRKYPYDPEKSMQLLQDAGFVLGGDNILRDSEGNEVTFSLMTNQENEMRTEMCTVIKENLADLGIDLELRFIDFSTLITKTGDSFDYDAAIMGLGNGHPDPSSLKDVFKSEGRLHLWYPQQETPSTEWEARIDELTDELNLHLDFETRKTISDEIQLIMAEEQPVLMLLSPNYYAGFKSKWKNIKMPMYGEPDWNLYELWADE